MKGRYDDLHGDEPYLKESFEEREARELERADDLIGRMKEDAAIIQKSIINLRDLVSKLSDKE